MYRTIKAENIQHRTPLAIQVGDEFFFGTAYKREAGVVTVALSNKKHLDFFNDDRVTISYTPDAEDAVKGIRRCTKCETPHLRRILTDKHATAYCDASAKKFRANAKDGTSERAKTAEAKQVAREERFVALIGREKKQRDYLVAVALRNAAKYTGRFEKVAAGYGLTTEEATAKVEYYFELVTA